MPLLPLLALGLLLALFPCSDDADGHHRPAVPAAVPVAFAPQQLGPTAAPVTHHDDGHPAACAPGPSGHLPQGRPASDGQGGGPTTGGAVLVPPGRSDAARRPGAPPGRAHSGRSTLAALCRCRI
ncbi:hypothetical protein ACFCVY_33345 [Streptomyces sp. NPDC056411]|uniref:hypothetical protein n=1 Tax=Streptomyces sp. NPDC056411 TaxID=3345813 RepID=UPI0035DFB786